MISSLRCHFGRFFNNSEGATATEYAIMAALIVVVCIGGLVLLGSGAADMFTSADVTPVLE